MIHTGKLQLTTPNDTDIVITRTFNAARQLVFDAHTKPELVRRWLLGPPGWTMPVCDIDLRVGGAYRYVWLNEQGTQMGMGGTYLDVHAPARIAATEKFDESWYPGEAKTHMTFVEHDKVTLLTLTVSYESTEARAIAMQSDMTQGMEWGYARLDELVASL